MSALPVYPAPIHLIDNGSKGHGDGFAVVRQVTLSRWPNSHGLAASETRKIQADLQTTQSAIEHWERSSERPTPLTEDDIRQAVTGADDLTRLLRGADRTERAQLYKELGLKLRYTKEAAPGHERIHVRVQLCRSGVGFEPTTSGL